MDELMVDSDVKVTARRSPRRIAYASIYDATDITKWRRAGHFMAKSLVNNGATLSYLGPLEVRRRWLTKPKGALHNRLLNKSPYRAYYGGRDRIVVRDLSNQLAHKLESVNVEAIVSGESPFSQPVAYLKTDLPIVVWTDVTFAGVIGFYPTYSHLCAETIRDGKANEAAALGRAALVVLSSEWAANAAIEHYNLDASKVRVANNGPGPMLEVSEIEVRRMIDQRPADRCRLLFLGENWERKGGEHAIRVAEALNAGGLPTDLLIAGCTPPAERSLPDFVQLLGWIDKATPDGARRFKELLGSAHFLVLPTLADCTPMVVCEASAHGVPSLTTDVGGLPWMVRDGLNGHTFPLDADPGDWRDEVVRVMGSGTYEDLALSAFGQYHERLNWDTQGGKVLGWLDEALAR